MPEHWNPYDNSSEYHSDDELEEDDEYTCNWHAFACEVIVDVAKIELYLMTISTYEDLTRIFDAQEVKWLDGCKDCRKGSRLWKRKILDGLDGISVFDNSYD